MMALKFASFFFSFPDRRLLKYLSNTECILHVFPGALALYLLPTEQEFCVKFK